MKKFKYLKISNTKKLRYIANYFRKKLYIIFLPGFMSDIEGEKPKTLFKFAKKNKLGFLSLEYSGHGKSSGIFTRGNISIWSNESKKMIKNAQIYWITNLNILYNSHNLLPKIKQHGLFKKELFFKKISQEQTRTNWKSISNIFYKQCYHNFYTNFILLHYGNAFRV